MSIVDDPVLKAGVSFGGIGFILNGAMQWLTPGLTFLGLVLAVAWYSVEIWESKAVQDWLERRRARKSIGVAVQAAIDVAIKQALPVEPPVLPPDDPQKS